MRGQSTFTPLPAATALPWAEAWCMAPLPSAPVVSNDATTPRAAPLRRRVRTNSAFHKDHILRALRVRNKDGDLSGESPAILVPCARFRSRLDSSHWQKDAQGQT